MTTALRVSLNNLLNSGLILLVRVLLNIHKAFSGEHKQRLSKNSDLSWGEPKIASVLNICVGGSVPSRQFTSIDL